MTSLLRHLFLETKQADISGRRTVRAMANDGSPVHPQPHNPQRFRRIPQSGALAANSKSPGPECNRKTGTSGPSCSTEKPGHGWKSIKSLKGAASFLHHETRTFARPSGSGVERLARSKRQSVATPSAFSVPTTKKREERTTPPLPTSQPSPSGTQCVYPDNGGIRPRYRNE